MNIQTKNNINIQDVQILEILKAHFPIKITLRRI